MDCDLPGSSVHGNLQARILEWVAISYSRGYSPPRDPTQVSCVIGGCFTVWAIIPSFSLVQFSHSVVSDSLRPHGLQHTRPSCPSPTPRVYSNSSHRVNDAIQPSHLLSSPSPPAPNPSQHQSLFQWVSSLHQVTKVLELQLQHQSFQGIFRTDFL